MKLRYVSIPSVQPVLMPFSYISGNRIVILWCDADAAILATCKYRMQGVYAHSSHFIAFVQVLRYHIHLFKFNANSQDKQTPDQYGPTIG